MMAHFILVRPDRFSLSDVECDGPRNGTLCGWRHILSCSVLGLAIATTIRQACGVTTDQCPYKNSFWDIMNEPATIVVTINEGKLV